ncbi:hypothetical protein ACFLVO_02270 [Chloroflexota bacterium]
MSEGSKNRKSYRTSALLFMISGIVFIILCIIPGRITVFLPIGIALLIIGMGIWQNSRKIKENEQGNSSDTEEQPEDKTKNSKLASMMFIFYGLTYWLAGIISAVVNKAFSTGNLAAFLIIGIALIVVGLRMRQRQKNQTDN